MVYVDRRRYRREYEKILSSAREGSSSSNGGSVSVLVLVAPDTDALCACRIFVKMLSHDHVGHNVVPVSGWSDLARINREMIAGNSKLRNVMLINLGSLVDLSDYFSIPERCRLHVIDSHRPCNLDNLFSAHPEAEQIVVWDDGDIDEDMTEEKAAYEALQYEPDTDSEDEAEDSEEEDMRWRERQRRLLADSDDENGDGSGSGSETSRGKRRRLDDNGNEIDDSGHLSSNGMKEKSSKQKPMTRRQKQLYNNRIKRYYEAGTWYGQSVAGQMYTLAILMRRADNDYLWLAILGLTYQFSANLIDRESYDNYASVLSNEVTRLNIEISNGHANGFNPVNHISSHSNRPDDRSIRLSEEFRFMLFRHWNLYDAMFHSGYVAGKLKLHRDRGRKNLQGLLAKMGFSLDQCRQTYAHMDMDLKRTLRAKVEGVAPEYGLYELSYPSFIRAFGYQSILAAADVVECIAALLEVANGVRMDFGNEVGGAVWSGSKSWASGIGRDDGLDEEAKDTNKENLPPANGTANGNAQTRTEEAAAVAAAKAKQREEAWWVRNFWMAYDALGNDTALLRSALPLSMALHRALIRQGTGILDKQAIKTIRNFRFCVLKEGPDVAVFTHPATLSRLAHWLVDAIRDILESSAQGSKAVKPMPLVLAALDEQRDSYLIVGIASAAEYGDVRKNRFGLAFQEASQASGTRTRHDKFDASIVEIRKDDITAFLQRLQIKL